MPTSRDCSIGLLTLSLAILDQVSSLGLAISQLGPHFLPGHLSVRFLQYPSPATTKIDCPSCPNRSTCPCSRHGQSDHGRQVRGGQYLHRINGPNKKDANGKGLMRQNLNNLSEPIIPVRATSLVAFHYPMWH